MTQPNQISLTATIAGQGFTALTVTATGTADDPEQLARDLTRVIHVLETSDDAARLITARTIARVTLDNRATDITRADALAAREEPTA